MSLRPATRPGSGHAPFESTRPAVVIAVANAVLVIAAIRGHADLVLVAAICVPLALVVVRRPQLAILGLVALVPYDGLLAVVPHPEIVQAWKEALTILALLATFVAPHAARASGRRKMPDWVFALAGLVAIGACSAVYVGGLTGVYGLKVYFFFALVPVVLWRCPFNGRERDRLITILMVNGVITSIVGLGQQVIGPDRLNSFGYEYNTVIRFSGSFLRSFSTFDQPFGFGYFVMIVLLICVPVALADPTRRRNQLFLFMLPLLGLGLMSSFVRGAILGLAAGVVYLGGHRFRVLLLAIPIGLVAVLLLPGDVASAALSSTSSGERVTNWQDNIGHLASQPLGAGIGTTGAAAERVQQLEGRTIKYYQPDNYYFLVSYELGPLGLWMHVLLVFAVLALCRRSAVELKGPDGAFAAGVTAFVIAAAVASFVSSFFGIFPNDVLFWTFVGIISAHTAKPVVA